MSIIVDAALSALFQVLFEKLASSELLNFAREKQVLAEIRKWETTLTKIQAVLEDAEEKQMINRSVQIWLSDLKDLAYDVEDVLDEFATECLRRRLISAESRSNSKSKLRKLVPSCCAYFNPKTAMFNSTMMGKIKQISTKLEDVASRRNGLDLRENVVGSTKKVWKLPSSSCLQNEPQVYGRDDDKRRILDLMLKEDRRVSVVAIVGMGGVGKTTLARVVYHDKECEHFDVKSWVCVSDDFDVLRITKAILESITLQPCELKELNQVQLMLSKELRGKRFLIVLDDVWSENYGNWNVLSSPFMDGANGSKVIITTRSAAVGKTMGTVENHTLPCISDDDCWLLFARHAFENRSTSSVDLQVLKDKVVYRCGGLPLAAKTLGGLLRSKHESEWENILSSKIWNSQGSENDILPVLKLSYFHLPSYLKRCFAYCAILPKDYEFDEKELVLLWMAEGLIQQTESEMLMEDIAMEYFRDLSSRSFFQPSGNGDGLFVMHDLVNDLALNVAGKTCCRLENGEEFLNKRARHSSYVRGNCDGVRRFQAFHNIKHLRTFLPLSLSYETSYIAYEVPAELLSKLRFLRVLSFSHYNITELPDSIGELKLLRYLNLSYTKIRTLPESTTHLCNLQTLILEECSCLKELPSEIGNLVNLRHLDLTNVHLAKGFPLGVKELKNLLTLSNFSVGKDGGVGLAILRDLKYLRGELHISMLENVNEIQQVRDANLMDKTNLDALSLEWEYDGTRKERLDRDVLDGLQPHRKLRKLSVTGYGGKDFPPWIRDSYLLNLDFLKLEDCKNCVSLPQIGSLPSLKGLIIKGMASVKMIDHASSLKPFGVLETLHFVNMREWEEWNVHGVEFPCLGELVIENCPKFSGNLPKRLPLLKKLVIRECEQLVVSLPSLPRVSVLEIERCRLVDCENVAEFGSSCRIVFTGIPCFSGLTEGFIKGLKEAKDLNVNGDSFPSQADFAQVLVDGEGKEILKQDQIGSKLETLRLNDCQFLPPFWSLGLMSLRELTIEDCSKLVSFSQVSFPATLRVIEIQNCSSLVSLPDDILDNCLSLEVLRVDRCTSLLSFGSGHFPPSLKRLVIQFCPSLQALYQTEECENNSCNLEFLSIEGCHSLSSTGRLPFSLKHLWISNCSELTSLSSGTELPLQLECIQIWDCPELISISTTILPANLKHLEIWYCSKLVSIAETFENNTSLECISIRRCYKLKSLPNGMHKLNNLQNISLSGWPCSDENNKFEGLLDGIHQISSLQTLSINDCPGIVSFPEQGFPTTLTTLWTANLKICNSLFEWGLHRLACLKELHILEGPDVVCFPDDKINMTLPSSLIHLSIGGFTNLEYLSTRGFQNLESLEFLSLLNCPKLFSLPKHGLPQSLCKLFINNCPLLKDGVRITKALSGLR